MLADGVVTEAELARAEDMLIACMDSRGYLVRLGRYGALDATPKSGVSNKPADIQHELATCRHSSAGGVIDLYRQVYRNPDNADETLVMAECLVRSGAVARGYSAADFQKDRMANPRPAYIEGIRGRTCSLDGARAYR